MRIERREIEKNRENKRRVGLARTHAHTYGNIVCVVHKIIE
jgi:hypothetical protein